MPKNLYIGIHRVKTSDSSFPLILVLFLLSARSVLHYTLHIALLGRGLQAGNIRIRKTYTQARYIFPLTRPPLFPASLLFPYLVLLIASTVLSYLSIYLCISLCVLPRGTQQRQNESNFFRYSRDTWVESSEGKGLLGAGKLLPEFWGPLSGSFILFPVFLLVFIFFCIFLGVLRAVGRGVVSQDGISEWPRVFSFIGKLVQKVGS